MAQSLPGPLNAPDRAKANYMTEHPHLASSWAGRVLVKIKAEESEHPKVSQTRMLK